MLSSDTVAEKRLGTARDRWGARGLLARNKPANALAE